MINSFGVPKSLALNYYNEIEIEPAGLDSSSLNICNDLYNTIEANEKYNSNFQ